jgi:uncharacterized protein YneF (UPF0154 family)
MDDKRIEFTKPTFIKALSELYAYVATLEDDKTYFIDIKEQKKKRSLNANRYLWVMCQQIAEALGKKYLSEKYEVYSAGTETKPQINQDAVRIMIQTQNGAGAASDTTVKNITRFLEAQTGKLYGKPANMLKPEDTVLTPVTPQP